MPGYADTRLPGESERGGGGSKKRDFRKDESGPALSLSPMKRQYEPCPVIAEYELKGGVRVRNLKITLPERNREPCAPHKGHQSLILGNPVQSMVGHFRECIAGS